MFTYVDINNFAPEQVARLIFYLLSNIKGPKDIPYLLEAKVNLLFFFLSWGFLLNWKCLVHLCIYPYFIKLTMGGYMLKLIFNSIWKEVKKRPWHEKCLMRFNWYVFRLDKSPTNLISLKLDMCFNRDEIITKLRHSVKTYCKEWILRCNIWWMDGLKRGNGEGFLCELPYPLWLWWLSFLLREKLSPSV